MNEDFEEFFALLRSHRVQFLVIGGVAYNFHAPPRATKDIDIWVQPTRANLRRLVAALAESGVDVEQLDLDDLSTRPRVLMLGRVPTRIDILTRPDGLTWQSAWKGRVSARYGRVPIALLGISQLIAGKRAAGRTQDLADVAKLERILRRRSRTRKRS